MTLVNVCLLELPVSRVALRFGNLEVGVWAVSSCPTYFNLEVTLGCE